MVRFRGAAIVVLLIALQLSAFSANAAGEFPVTGTVTNLWGEPIAKARVTDGVRSALTSTDGTYRLSASIPGSWRYSVTKQGFITPPAVEVLAVDPRGTDGVDFVMFFSLQTAGAPNALNPSVTNEVAIRATSIAPSDSCVTWRDLSSGTTVNLQPGTPEPPVWSSTTATNVWTGTYTLPGEIVEGLYQTETIATHCESGVVLSNIARFNYVSDRSAPVAGSPYENGIAPNGNLTIKMTDARSGIDPSQCFFSLDGGPWQSISSWSPWQGLGITNVPITDGLHEVRFRAGDRAGNVAEGEFSFTGDIQAPSLTDHMPVGMTRSTPLIGVSISDLLSGVNPSSLSMKLTGGDGVEVDSPVIKAKAGRRSGNVKATWDEVTRRFEYQVPSVVTGSGIGEAPLLPGIYEVEVIASDQVGNTSSLKWTFTVEGP